MKLKELSEIRKWFTNYFNKGLREGKFCGTRSSVDHCTDLEIAFLKYLGNKYGHKWDSVTYEFKGK